MCSCRGAARHRTRTVPSVPGRAGQRGGMLPPAESGLWPVGHVAPVTAHSTGRTAHGAHRPRTRKEAHCCPWTGVLGGDTADRRGDLLKEDVVHLSWSTWVLSYVQKRRAGCGPAGSRPCAGGGASPRGGSCSLSLTPGPFFCKVPCHCLGVHEKAQTPPQERAGFLWGLQSELTALVTRTLAFLLGERGHVGSERVSEVFVTGKRGDACAQRTPDEPPRSAVP